MTNSKTRPVWGVDTFCLSRYLALGSASVLHVSLASRACARKRGVPLPCVTSAYTTSSRALQRSVTSLRPTTSSPVHVGLPHLRIPQRRSAFFLPGTELAFSAEVICASSRLFGWRTISSRMAIFRQIDKDVPQVHHDALEFPDGTLVLLTDLHEGQQATVLQLPAQPKTLAKQRPRRASCASANIRRITRLPPEPWWCRRPRVPRTPSLLIKRPNRLTSAVMIAHLHWHKSGAPAAGRVS